MRNHVLVLIGALFLTLPVSCSSTKIPDLSPNELRWLDSLAIPPSWIKVENVAQPNPISAWKILHQKVAVEYDSTIQQFKGSTQLFLLNLRSRQAKVEVTSKDMAFSKVTLSGSRLWLPQKKNGDRTEITLDKYYGLSDTVAISIHFNLDPQQEAIQTQQIIPTFFQPIDGWRAITEESLLPLWFPTLSDVHHRFTHELWLTVPSEWKTVSNGVLIEQRMDSLQQNRVDYWRMDEPHPARSIGFVAGPMTLTRQFEKGHTFDFFFSSKASIPPIWLKENVGSALSFLEQQTNSTFPYRRLSTVVANTLPHTARSLASFLWVDERWMLDSTTANVLELSPELVRLLSEQWFGGLLSSFSEEELSLINGLSGMMELHWISKQKTTDTFYERIMEHRRVYLQEAQEYRRSLTQPRVEGERWKDAHSRSKSVLVLRALQHYMGEESWSLFLQRLVAEYENQAVTLEQVQELAELESGLPLSTFFDQWFNKAGHPTLDAQLRSNTVTLRQVHDLERQPLYSLQIPIWKVYSDSISKSEIRFYSKDTTVVLTDADTELWIDPEHVVPAEWDRKLSEEEVIRRMKDARAPLSYKMRLFSYVLSQWSTAKQVELYLHILAHDSSDRLRMEAARQLLRLDPEKLEPWARNCTPLTEPSGRVRIQSVYYWAQFGKDDQRLMLLSLMSDPDIFVRTEALKQALRSGSLSLNDLPNWWNKSSYGHLSQRAVAQGLENQTTNEALKLFKTLLEPHMPPIVVQDALSALTWEINSQNQSDFSTLLQRVTSLTKHPSRSVRLEAFRTLYRHPDSSIQNQAKQGIRSLEELHSKN